jgi:hypothetical protein
MEARVNARGISPGNQTVRPRFQTEDAESMMNPVPEIAVRGFRALMSWRGLLCVGLIALALSQPGPPRSVSRQEAASQQNCEAWDRAASEGIAAIIPDNRAASELRLDEAILQLRRARKNCRSGSIDLAGRDYTALHRTYPASTGSIRASSHDVAAGAEAPMSPQR